MYVKYRMDGVIKANNNYLTDVLMRVIPDEKKKKRLSNTQASTKVLKSVKGKISGFSGEQGFKNYKKYTDPTLQFGDETTDKSQLADDLAEILSTFKPKKKVIEQEIKKEPVDYFDALSEIQPSPLDAKHIGAAKTIKSFLKS